MATEKYSGIDEVFLVGKIQCEYEPLSSNDLLWPKMLKLEDHRKVDLPHMQIDRPFLPYDT